MEIRLAEQRTELLFRQTPCLNINIFSIPISKTAKSYKSTKVLRRQLSNTALRIGTVSYPVPNLDASKSLSLDEY
jgi:hypothetical protein